MSHVVASEEHAITVVEYFNGFHDGFIRRLTLVSHDSFESRDVHVMTGILDVDILFAHSNYRQGLPPFDQLIEARFTRVRDLRVSFTGEPTDWPIQSLRLNLEPVASANEELRLRARLMQSRLVDDSRWEPTETLTFSFHAAEFRELAGP